MKSAFCLVAIGALVASSVPGQSLNIDFGDPANGPPPSYGAAGLSGTWNSFPALHGNQETDLLGLDGQPTAVLLQQIGGLENLTDHDPAISGSDAKLMDDFLITFSATLESCIFLDGLEAGEYEVLIYARMPDALISSYTDVDQEPGNPHLEVGGAWAGTHQESITFARHFATVSAEGSLDLHSGVVPGADPLLGAALNGVQLIFGGVFFRDGFETGDTTLWN